MTAVHVLSAGGFSALLGKLLPATEFALQPLDLRALVASVAAGSGLGLSNYAIILIHGNAKITGAPAEVHDAADAAAWLRREEWGNPIIWLSGETPRLAITGDDAISGTVAETDGGKVLLPWFAPLYDTALALPYEQGQLRAAVETARSRIGTRRPLVEAAITRAQQTHLERVGTREDHLWKNFQAVLRFLRGAQAEWMIHPKDAKAVLTHIKAQVDADEDLKRELGTDANTLLLQQGKRWETYEKTFARCGKVQKRFEDYAPGDLPYRLLLVDDQHERMGWKVLLERLLAPHGFAVDSDDGQSESLLATKVRSVKYDVVLLDLNLKLGKTATGRDKEATTQEETTNRKEEIEDLTGLERLKTIRRFAPHTPVIYFTRYERFSLERERHQLGVVDYIVKEEDVVRQDAQGYYNRLVRLCRRAIEYEMRALILLLAEQLAGMSPALYEKIGMRLRSAIMELDDPLVTCIQAGLVVESAVIYTYASKTKDRKLGINVNEFKKNNAPPVGASWTPAREWIEVSTNLRNSTAHPEIGSFQLESLDALLAAGLSVYLLFKCGGHSLDATSENNLRRLLSLALRHCASCLNIVHDNWTVAPDSLRLSEATTVCEEMWRTAREIESKPASTAESGLKSLRDFLDATLSVMGHHLLRLGRVKSVCSASTSDIRSLCLSGSGPDTVAIEGYEHLALVPHVYLHPTRLRRLTGDDSLQVSDLFHLTLLTIAMTRITSWCWNRIVGDSCPASQLRLLRSYKGGVDEAECEKVLARTPEFVSLASRVSHEISMAPAYRLFLVSLVFSRRRRQCSATVTTLGEIALAEFADTLLLQPAINNYSVSTKRVADIACQEGKVKLKIGSLKRDLEPVANTSGNFRTQRDELQGKKKQLDAEMEKNKSNWQKLEQLNKAAGELETQLSTLKPLLEQVEDEELKLMMEQDDAQREFERLQGERARIAGQLPRLKQLADKYTTIGLGLGEAPSLVLQTVRECAPQLEPDLMLALACLRSWVWDERRYDLPILLAEISAKWRLAGKSYVV